MDTCSLRLTEGKVSDELVKLTGSNDVAKMSMFLFATSNGEFSNDFIEYYKDVNNTSKAPNIETEDSKEAKKIAETIKEYWTKKHADIDSESRIDEANDLVKIKGYSSIFDRELGKTHIATMALDIFNEAQNSGRVLPANKLNFYRRQLKNKWLDLIIKAAAKRNNIDESGIRIGYNNTQDKAAYIDSLLGGKNKNITESNYFAVYQELFASDITAIEYITEALSSPRCADIMRQIRSELESEAERLAADASQEENGENSQGYDESNDIDLDTTIFMLNNHIGQYTSFMTHVGPRIRNYFNTLRKHATANIDDYDTSNNFGLAECMDANACSSMLYNRGIFTNVPAMIESIRNIGKTVRGFEAFVKFAFDLNNNYDFATEVYTVFAKTKIARLETRVEDGVVTVKQSNIRINERDTFVFDLMNDIKGTIIQNVGNVIFSSIKELQSTLTAVSQIKDKTIATEQLNKCKEQIVKLVKTYFPSIEEKAIISYIEINNNAGNNIREQIRNIDSLLKDIEDTCKNSALSRNAYEAIQFKANEIIEYNKGLRAAQASGKWVDPSDFKNLKEVYSDDYIESQISSIQNIVTKLLPYSVIKTDFNSRNIYGNNNSDIINSSWITQLKDMSEEFYRDTDGKLRNERLEEWGRRKLRNKQYKYSNLLVEQPGLDNKALFRVVNGQVCLTEKADEYIKIYLFNGSANMDDGTNASYADMTEGDFLPTTFINFFNTDSRGDRKALANYFLRTPSDAPKTFAMRAPRYSTRRLFIVENMEEFKANIEDIISTYIPLVDSKTFSTKYLNDANNLQVSKLNSYKLNSFIFPTNDIAIDNALSIKKIDGTEQESGTYEAYVPFMSEDGLVVVLRGTVEKYGRAKKLTNTKLEAIVNQSGNSKNSFEDLFSNVHSIASDYFSKKLRTENVTIGNKTWNKPKQVADINHPIYKMIKNQFKQEMLNAGVALNHYFELEEAEDGTYYVRLENNKPVFRNKRKNTKGFQRYHLGKDGKVISKKGDRWVLGGNVFHSTKFTLENNNNGIIKNKNYFDTIIDDSSVEKEGTINFLYGRGFKLIGNRNENGDLIITDVEFSDKQNEEIDKALSDYLYDYNKFVFDYVKQYEGFIKGVDVNIDNVTDFSMNYLMMFFNYDELFEGDTKFYKTAQDVLKRAKEYQGSGIPYGVANYSAFHMDDLQELDGKDGRPAAFLNIGEIDEVVKDEKGKTILKEDGTPETRKVKIQDIFAGSMLEGTRLRNGFRAVTIKNSVSTNEKALKLLVEKLVENGADRDDTMDILFGKLEKDKNGDLVRRGGFTETKVNDAQSYITIKEWIRRIAARGQLIRYLPLIRKLIAVEKNPNLKLSAEDIHEFIQVQKNFYYDLHYFEEYGIEVPRQIKNAEFVLIPQLIKGTQLYEVYKLMEKANIDQINTVETSKASNEEILTLWDNDGNISQERLDNFAEEANENAQVYSYNNLYTQQETPQHMNAENKAGIQITKKIIDNLPDDDSELGQLKRKFHSLYSTNIKESAFNVIREFKIPVNENGNIILDEDGNIKSLDLKAFYKRLEEELMRTGIDSNMKDYVTIPKDSIIPLMPNFDNRFISKFENIIASIFNNNITRQKLPGFHAAQVTNIGFKPISDNIEKVSYAEDLEYHPNGEGYIEVKVPYSYLGIDKNSEHYKDMSDSDILKELEKNGKLNMIIGYRIPTEGKQSVCNMKIKGFISDAFGSTIIVPNDWVSQTGSDFDIDSVYAITAETYKTSDGQIKKIEYKNSEDLTIYDWFSYIRTALDRNIDLLNEEINKIIEDFEKEKTEIYDNFTEKHKIKSKEFEERLKKQVKEQGLEKIDSYKLVIRQLIKGYESNINRAKGKDTKYVENAEILVAKLKEIDNFLSNQSQEYNKRTKERINNILSERMQTYEDIAKKAGLLSWSEFKKPENEEIANSKKARNSKISDIMQTILAHPDTLEENLSRSNCDDQTQAISEIINENMANSRDARSPYNIISQIQYQEDAMSGSKLKAFSVTLDSFCSVCNVVKPKLEEPIYIVYNTSDFKNPSESSKRFGGKEVSKKDKTFAVRHSYYGWSEDYRNISGRILTAYSSQTTAYILDAIKVGPIPNVNQYTFGVYKTLLNIGSDYRTAVAFIIQPGISEIVKIYNSNKSVFSIGKGNAVHQAIRNIATKLGVNASVSVPITTVLESLNKRYGKRFNEIYKQKGDEDITIGLDRKHTKDLPLIVNKLISRIKETNEFDSTSPVEDKLLFDLGSILLFNHIYEQANEIGNIVRCCNPDRFGAKQTIFSTRKVFENIDKIIYNRESIPAQGTTFNINGQKETTKLPNKPALSVDGKHILEAIYPGIANPIASVDKIIEDIIKNDRIQDSRYKPLYAFLKYASATSVIVAKKILLTQDTNFIKLIDNFKSVLSGNNPELSEKTYNDVQKYIISYITQQIPAIKYAVHFTKKEDVVDLTLDKDTSNIAVRNESARIYGYNRGINIDVKIADINNPTKEEIIQFERLSPAQKVSWIQKNFTTNAGIFSLLNVSLFNGKNRGRYAGMQTIEYREQNISSNVVYAEFRKAFFHKNPLIVSAAVDIIKYGVQVEGMRMTAYAVNKVIDNDCLINSFGPNGIGYVDFIVDTMVSIGTNKGIFSQISDVEQLYENYLRSHPNVEGISTIYLNDKTKARYGLNRKLNYGMYYLRKDSNKKTDEENTKAFNQRMEDAGIKYYLPKSDKYLTNKYIRIQEKQINTLYKIVDKGEYIVLYPLSKLEVNENSEWSSNSDNNNTLLNKHAYELIIKRHAIYARDKAITYEFISDIINKAKEKGLAKDFWYKDTRNITDKVKALDFNLKELAEQGGAASITLQQIINHFNNPNIKDSLFIRSNVLQDYIITPGITYGHKEKIKIAPNDVRTVIIYIPGNKKDLDNSLREAKANGKKIDILTINNSYLRDIINDIQNEGGIRTDGVFKVEEVKDIEDSYAAELEELDDIDVTDIEDVAFEQAITEAIDFAQSMKDNIDETNSPINYIERLRMNNITIGEQHSISANKIVSSRETARFVRSMTDYIKNKLFNQFVENPDVADEFIKITDKRIIALIKKDATLFNKYIKAINVASAFIERFRVYRDLNIDSEDIDIKRYISEIKESLEEISKLPLSQLRERGLQVEMDKVSTNPLYKQGFIDVMESYYKTYGNMWKYNDIMENGTPILQVVMKDVMRSIEASRKHFENKVRKEYLRRIKEIQDLAAKNGVKINISKIIDDDGRFIQDYKQELVDKINELRQFIKDAAKSLDENGNVNGYGSIAHLKAKLAYDEFKAKHINQPAKPEYYIEKCEAERRALERIPKLYSKYMKLYIERQEIYQDMSKDGLTDEQRKRLQDIQQEMYNLYRPNYYVVNGELLRRPYREENVSYNSEQEENIEIYSEFAAAELRNYIDKIKSLNKTYFGYESVYGFNDQLKNALHIVETFEDRDSNGIPQKPQDWLDAQPEYVAARDWLRENARFEMDESVSKTGEAIGIGAKIKEALGRLSMTSKGKHFKANQIIKEATNGKGIRDSHGVPDGRLLTDEQRASIKQAQEDIFGTTHFPAFTDRILISNAKPDGAIFSSEFYEQMASDGNANPEYLRVVTELNKLLEPYFNNLDKNVHLENIPDTEEGIELLLKIAEKYQELRSLKKTDNATNAEDVATFIKDNVEFVTNKPIWIAQNMAAREKSAQFVEAWNKIAYERNADGEYIIRDGKFVPNRFLYTYVKPKGKPGDASYDRFVDNKAKQRTEDLNLIHTVYRKTSTTYYYQTRAEAMRKAEADPNYSYQKWYNDNHVYNPYTRKMEPLDCWVTTEIRDELFKDNTYQGQWVPRGKQQERKVKDGTTRMIIAGKEEEFYDKTQDMRNKNYDPKKGIVGNYVKGSQGGIYDSDVELNEYEIMLRDYLKETLEKTAKVESARKYFRDGYLPMQMKAKTDKKTVAKEIGKIFGFAISTENGEKPFHDDIGFAYDRTPLMPMLRLLESKQTIDLSKKLKGLKEKIIEREQFNSDEEYENAIKDNNKLIATIEEQINKERKSLIDKDWLKVIENYLEQANYYNAVQENKQKLYLLHDALKNLKAYSRKFGGSGDLKSDERRSSTGEVYSADIDENLIKQYENHIRRMLFDQWKEPEGKLTKIANALQGFTSANYMMLNVRGGIANVTLGETGIFAEAVAGEVLGKKHWIAGSNEWRKGIIGFARGGYNSMFNNTETSYNKQEAISKFFNVVDYDEVTGVSRELSIAEYAKKIRDMMFSPQSIGEHFLQNSVLYAMLMSHKIIVDENNEVIPMSERQYIEYRQGQLLNEILTEKQQKEFAEFRKKLKENKNKLKDYMWFRRDVLTDFIYLHCDNKQIQEFIKLRKSQEETIKKEFAEKKSLYEQIELGKDGKMAFIKGSELAELDEQPYDNKADFSKAMALCGEFAEKVRKVNNKIHGVYNRLGSAYIERTWYGSLIMQYHKHLPIGLLKRYMARGHYNETRGTVDKGMVQTIADIAKLNYDKIKIDAGLTETETNALKGFAFLITHIADYVRQLKTTWNIIPAYERANFRRNFGDLAGVLGAMMTVAALWYIADDDEDIEDNLFFNLALYEADRLASEAFMYNPIGMMSEGKKLMSTPIAAQSVISDIASSSKAIVEFMFDDEYDPYYHSGRFAGEPKLLVYIQRRIPMWNGVRSLIDTPDNNHYYKLGQNPIGMFDIKEMVTD